MGFIIDEHFINLLEQAEREPVVYWPEPPTGILKTITPSADEIGESQELSALQTSLPVLNELNLECLKMPFTDSRKHRLGKVLEKLILKTKNRLKQFGVRNV